MWSIVLAFLKRFFFGMAPEYKNLIDELQEEVRSLREFKREEETFREEDRGKREKYLARLDVLEEELYKCLSDKRYLENKINEMSQKEQEMSKEITKLRQDVEKLKGSMERPYAG